MRRIPDGVVLALAAVFSGCSERSASPLPEESNLNSLNLGTGWTVPARIAEVSTDGDERQVTISADNLSLYVNSLRDGNVGGAGTGPDIWVSHRQTISSPWDKLKNLGPVINTVGSEGAPNFSRDGHWMYFCSDGHPGFGGFDILRSYRPDIHDDFAWEPPENLGPVINTDALECDPFLFENQSAGEQTLYMSIFGKDNGKGDWDIYSSQLHNGQWTAPRLEARLDTPRRDGRMTLPRDGLEIVWGTNRENSIGGIDLWHATRPSTRESWSAPENLGTVINTVTDDRGPSVSLDGQTLYFTSRRDGARQGDVYVATRLP